MIREWTEELRGDEARAALLRGIKRVAGPVASTIGAKGRNVVFVEHGRAKPTNDGISVARRIWPRDPFERIGADLIKEVGEATVKEAGDGTSFSTVLAEAIAEFGEERIKANIDPMQLRAGLEEAAKVVVQKIQERKVDVKNREDILNVARISVEDEEMAQLITDAVERAGKHGVIIVEEGSGYGMEKEQNKGYFWERGYVSPYMVTNVEDGNKAILDDCPVIVTDRYMNLNRDLMQTLNELKAQGHNKALIIVDRCEGELLQSLIINKVKGVFTAIVVQKPGSLEELEDIAAVTGATAIMKDKGIKMITAMHVGKAKKVVVEEFKTTIIAEDEKPEVAKRLESIELVLKETKKKKGEAQTPETELLITRKAKLTDGIIVLRVGAKTEAERKYKKDKLDDGVAAAKAAVEEGIVPGGGTLLYEISKEGLGLTTVGAQVLCDAMRLPYERILMNALVDPDGKYYNVKTGKEVADMMKEGIIDPAKVIRCGVQNAVSFAATFLTLDSVIADFAEDTQTQVSMLGVEGTG